MTSDLQTTMDAFQERIEARDVRSITEILDDRYCLNFVYPLMKVTDRPEWLRVLEEYVIHEHVIEDQIIDCDGDCALVTSRIRMRAIVSGVDRSGTFVVSDVWRRRNDEWRLWRRTSTMLNPEQSPSAI